MAGPPFHIVLADDAPDIRTMLRLSLEADGVFRVVAEASDGIEAVEAASRHQPDLVLLDLAMPVMDGLEAIPHLRDRAPTSQIVILSGFATAKMGERAMSAGADAYLVKGTRPDEFAATLRGLVEAREAAGEADDEPGAAAGRATGRPPVPGRLAPATDLLPVLAHQLLNQVTVIEGFGTTLAASYDSLTPENRRQYAEIITRNARQMAELIHSVSDARRVEIGELGLEREWVELTELVGEAVAEMADVLEGHPLEVTEPISVRVEADPRRIRQVLTNLLSNAAKFSPPDSPITVEVGMGDGLAEVTVSDQGPGIPPSRADELFGQFSRLGTRIPGIGLGLYVSKGIARAHGGDLELVPSEQGVRLTLTLPLG